MRITTSAFEHGQEIPVRFTCQGDDVSPELTWSDVPQGTRSFALIVDDPDAPDPDAPRMTWVHWVLCNIPATVDRLSEGIAAHDLPRGTLQGLNDWGRTGYGGPCPPVGRHRYFFRLYALDALLESRSGLRKVDVLNAARGHILQEAVLMGTYAKK